MLRMDCPIGRIEFTYEERTMKWYKTNLDYTFILYVLEKVESHQLLYEE